MMYNKVDAVNKILFIAQTFYLLCRAVEKWRLSLTGLHGVVGTRMPSTFFRI